MYILGNDKDGTVKEEIRIRVGTAPRAGTRGRMNEIMLSANPNEKNSKLVVHRTGMVAGYVKIVVEQPDSYDPSYGTGENDITRSGSIELGLNTIIKILTVSLQHADVILTPLQVSTILKSVAKAMDKKS